MRLTIFIVLGILLGLMAGFFLFDKENSSHDVPFDPSTKNTPAPPSMQQIIKEEGRVILKISNLDDNHFSASQGTTASLIRLKDRCKIRIELKGRSGFSQLEYFFKSKHLLAAHKSTFYYPNTSLAHSQADRVAEQESYSHEVFNPQSERVEYEFASVLQYFPQAYLKQCQKF